MHTHPHPTAIQGTGSMAQSAITVALFVSHASPWTLFCFVFEFTHLPHVIFFNTTGQDPVIWPILRGCSLFPPEASHWGWRSAQRCPPPRYAAGSSHPHPLIIKRDELRRTL